MDERELNILLSELRTFPTETEWIEFKTNNDRELGKYISALSNSACIHDKTYAYLVFGIENKTHRIIGTTFDANTKAKGNEDLIPWLSRLLNPRMHFEHHILNHTEGRVVIFKIKATTNTPVTFQGSAFIRVGSYTKKLSEYPEKERLIWTKERVQIRVENGGHFVPGYEIESRFKLGYKCNQSKKSGYIEMEYYQLGQNIYIDLIN